jgi:flagellar biosynthesis protein FlhG
MHILPIASGKGGVGKSLVAANLAIALSQAGKRTVLADLDLGGSNLHLILGIRPTAGGIGTFLSHPGTSFETVIQQTGHPNLRFLPGDAEIPGLANLSSGQKRKLIRRLSGLDADFLILDLGAGTSFNIMDFFLISGSGLIVTVPTPTAIVNAYLFLKNAVFRILHGCMEKKSPAAAYLESLRKDGSSLQKMSIPHILSTIQDTDPTSYNAFQTGIARFRPRVIMNMLEDPKDSDKIGKLRASCRQYLGIDLEHLGIIYRDDLQDIALSSRLPIIVYKPRSVLSQALFRIADKLVQLSAEDEAPLTAGQLDQSYTEAQTEAEIDFESRIEYVEDLLQTGALSTGDLVETIKNQQYEIRQLKKENMLFKSKLMKAINQGFKP